MSKFELTVTESYLLGGKCTVEESIVTKGYVWPICLFVYCSICSLVLKLTNTYPRMFDNFVSHLFGSWTLLFRTCQTISRKLRNPFERYIKSRQHISECQLSAFSRMLFFNSKPFSSEMNRGRIFIVNGPRSWNFCRCWDLLKLLNRIRTAVLIYFGIRIDNVYSRVWSYTRSESELTASGDRIPKPSWCLVWIAYRVTY